MKYMDSFGFSTTCSICGNKYALTVGTILMKCCSGCYYKDNERTCQRCQHVYYKSPLSDDSDIYCKDCGELTCRQCKLKVKRVTNKDFCGEECQFKYENSTCKNCHSTFKMSETSNSDYCSEKCRDIHTHRNCLHCNKRFKFDLKVITNYYIAEIEKVRQLYCSDVCRNICMRKKCKHCKESFEYNPQENKEENYCSYRCRERDNMSLVGRLLDSILTQAVVSAYGGHRC